MRKKRLLAILAIGERGRGEEIMRLSKSQVSNAPVLLFADDNAANGREKKNPRENVSMKDARNDCGKVLCDDSK